MRRRPWGMWVVIALQIALFVTLLPGVAQTFPVLSPDDHLGLSREIYLGWAVLNLVAALWLWSLSRRGWVLTMVLVGVGLIANLYLWSIGQPAWVRMAIQEATAFYWNIAEIRELLKRRSEVEPIILRDTEAEAA